MHLQVPLVRFLFVGWGSGVFGRIEIVAKCRVTSAAHASARSRASEVMDLQVDAEAVK